MTEKIKGKLDKRGGIYKIIIVLRNSFPFGVFQKKVDFENDHLNLS